MASLMVSVKVALPQDQVELKSEDFNIKVAAVEAVMLLCQDY